MPDPYMQGSESITQAEHVSPAKTGDNIEAKRVANYIWNSTSGLWERDTGGGATGGATEATLEDVINQLSFLLDRLDFGMITDNAKRLKVVPEQATAANLNATIAIAAAQTLTNCKLRVQGCESNCSACSGDNTTFCTTIFCVA